MTKPPFLKSGDSIYILSTARSVQESDISAWVDFLKKEGYKVVLGKTIGPVSNQFAGDDSLRLEDLQTALDDPQIKAIWCARGGYGSVRILDKLDFSAFLKNPKWLLGFSDVTALHLSLQKMGFCSIHAFMGTLYSKTTESAQKATTTLLTGEKTSVQWPRHPLNSADEFAGRIMGGNLSVIYSMLGSADMPDTRNCILFLEDLDEYLYHIDRMCWALRRAGLFTGIKGLLIGGMSDMNDNSVPFGASAEETIAKHAESLNVPVIFGFPSGHISENNPIILGADVQVRTENQSLSLHYGTAQ